MLPIPITTIYIVNPRRVGNIARLYQSLREERGREGKGRKILKGRGLGP
jgi:hypothetical protein